MNLTDVVVLAEGVEDGGRIDLGCVHSYSHHGVSLSKGAFTNVPGSRTGPLQIIRRSFRLPKVSFPRNKLVVTQDIASEIGAAGFVVKLRPVEVVKYVDFYHPAGDVTWHDRLRGVDPEDYMISLPPTEAPPDAESLFELVPARQSDLPDDVLARADVGEFEGCGGSWEREELRYSEEIFRINAVQWWGYTILPAPLFDILDSHIDRHYYIIGHPEPNAA